MHHPAYALNNRHVHIKVANINWADQLRIRDGVLQLDQKEELEGKE